MKVTVDHREPAEVKAALAAVPGCELESAELPCGDFLVAEDAAIERKTANDFVSSILDGRFLAQARLLSDAYPRAFWIIEGDVFSVESAISRAAIAGAISYIAALQQSTILHVPTLRETAMVVTTVARHLQEGLGYVPNLRPGKPKNQSGYAEFLVSGLPGVGGTRAQALLARFGSPQSVFTASAADLASVKGISARLAEEIRFVLGG
jgi:ERCC4-type nuclease